MSIEQTLERIAVALEKLTNAPTTQPAPASTPAPAPAAMGTPPVSAGPPSATGPVGGPPLGVTGSPPGVAPGPQPATVPTAQGGPVAMSGPTTSLPPGVPGAGVPSPMTGPVAGAPGTTAPVTSTSPQPQQATVQGVPTLDDIKALANDFHRAHPERAGEFVQVLASKNAQMLSELPPASYPEVHGILKQMMGQG